MTVFVVIVLAQEAKMGATKAKFDLSLKERLFLVNQFRILEALYPDEAEYYAIQREAVSAGYTLN